MVIETLFLLPLGGDAAVPVLSNLWLLSSVVVVVVLSTTVPFYLEFEALRRLPARTYSILVSLEPAVAALVAAIRPGEALDVVAAIGATLFPDRYSR